MTIVGRGSQIRSRPPKDRDGLVPKCSHWQALVGATANSQEQASEDGAVRVEKFAPPQTRETQRECRPGF